MGRQAEPLHLPTEIASGRLDPFEARPLSREPAPSVDALLTHYFSNFAFRSFPFYASRSLVELWWPFVREDEVLFHVVLLLSRLDQQRLLQSSGEGQYDGVHARQLLDQCLRLLNARVADPVKGVSDGTLVAIASLAAMEHDRGNMRALDMVCFPLLILLVECSMPSRASSRSQMSQEESHRTPSSAVRCACLA